MDLSLISIDDAISLLEMYGEPVPNETQEIYAAAYDLLEQLSLDDPLPVGIEDMYIAQGLENIKQHIPKTNLSDILLSSEDSLIDLTLDLGLSQVDKERIIRILGYLGRLNDDTSFIDTLPLEIIEEIAVNLDCKSLFLLCSSSKKFNTLCSNTHVLKRVIRDKGYGGNLEQVDIKSLQYLCNLLSSDKFIPRQAYILNHNGELENVLDNVVQVSVGYNHYLFLTADGHVYGIGDNTEGQLGLPKRVFHNTLQLIPRLDNIVAISAGYFHTLCVTVDGKVYGFGRNIYGELGALGLGHNNTIPQLIPGLDNIKQTSVGRFYSLFLTFDGEVYGSGVNVNGELGLGNIYDVKKPTLIPEMKNIVQVSVGRDHSLCLREDGRVYRFGNNASRQLGTKKALFKEPSLSNNLKDIVKVSAGADHSLFLTKDGTVYGLGSNENQELGFSSKVKKVDKPTLIPNVRDIVAISAGAFRSLCLSADGQLHIFGRNNIIKDLNEFTDSPVMYGNAKSLNEVISAGKGDHNDDLVLI